ncbi:MAG: YbaB/EbfC family nucleoid-associated protein [Acidimicrobiia bacterium]
MSDAPEESQGFDLSALVQQAQAMQERLLEAQAEIRNQVVEGRAGGGAVRIVATGGLEFREIHIDPAAVDPEDISMLEDLLLAALNDVVANANDLNSSAVGQLGFGGLPGVT